jgi:hypothetical protein
VLRQLIINLDKDYGSRALKNTKKVEKSEKKLIQYNERMEKYKQEKFAQETAQRELEEMTNVKAEESNNE